ncbi:sacsin N-terminal ATP-binding-like domain-containing protein [Sphingomonas segetis]|uniref:sacsin N-terminal ATP-binding-like domain-containing protein n=1 Tax=Sphingomonas segetis TaxID=1104779 RepID=UPI0018AD4DAF|nr:hypothetical protein [Sphingomonas segetis]
MLDAAFQAELELAATATAKGSQAYESLKNLSEVIGGEYGERVLYELIQNAHDAHEEGSEGQILVRLVVETPDRGDLYVANGGRGFEWANVQALRNIAVSSKTVGEGIGNKGLGFRSVETLTDDPRIYSQAIARKAERFDGFCFRFARQNEILQRAASITTPEIAAAVAETLPRYLASTPIERQEAVIRSFAAQGFATCVHVPLRRAQAISAAEEQIDALINSRAPLLLFLDRLSKIVIEIERSGQTKRKTLRRRPVERLLPASASTYEIVTLEPGAGRYLVVKSAVDREPLLAAVEDSVDQEPQLARWRKWQGTPFVAVGIPLSSSQAHEGVAYNFLPMSLDRPSPMLGHIDAPFYASINRKEADYALPLNAFLLDAVAKCAATAALELRPLADKIGRAAIFDLAAWDPDDTDRLSLAWDALGQEWESVEVVPAAGGGDRWSTIFNSWIWEEEGLRLLRVRRLVKAGVGDIADPKLGLTRLERLSALISAAGVASAPDDSRLAEWTELVAASLHSDKASPKTWSTFYQEVQECIGTVSGLKQLQGRQFFIGRDGELHAAAEQGQGSKPLFLRDAARGRRTGRDRVALPPSSISRKFAFVDDAVEFPTKLVDDFVAAGLVRRYDPLEILENVHSLFGDKPAPGRREDVLRWAFDVWRSEGTRAEPALAKADIRVESQSGWKPASHLRFSARWTSEGQKLAVYLAEAAPFSPDCTEAAGLLLPDFPPWAPQEEDKRKDWISFLRLLGVRDGLPLLADTGAPKEGSPANLWNFFRLNVNSKTGRTQQWTEMAYAVDLPNPYTDYQRRGELWRLPGQVEHEQLPIEARHRLCELILALLAQPDASWRYWKLGRYDRWSQNINERQLPTPAAAFLRTAKWLPVDSEDSCFERPGRLWSMQGRRQRPPKFVPRLPDRLSDFIAENDRLRDRMYGRSIGLRDWAAPAESLARLAQLAAVADQLETSNRAEFRRSYLAAWTQLLESPTALPRNFDIAVQIGGAYERRAAVDDEMVVVYLSGNLQSAEARAASSANLPILELEHEEQVDKAVALLADTGRYDARPIDHGGVQVIVDGAPFAPSYEDPLLASGELEWLVDAAILAKEVGGRRTFEDAIPSGVITEKLAKVRLRFARDVRLAISGSESGDALQFYGYRDPNLPTLIIGDGRALDVETLAEGAATLQQLLDGRFRSFETLLVKLALWSSPHDPFERPTDQAFAKALGCKIETVRDFLAERQGDNRQLVARLVPVVAYYSGVEVAKDFEARLAEIHGQEAIQAALAQNTEIPLPADELLAIANAASDLNEMRKRLGLEFRLLNEVLVQLGAAPLSNEAELRRLFDVWKSDLKPTAVDRLRRHFWKSFEDGESVEEYVNLRTLDFVIFPDEWALGLETVSRKDVADLIDLELETRLGPDLDIKIPALAETAKRSQRQLKDYCDGAAEIVAAWCHVHNVASGAWVEGTAELLKRVDQQGLFDFALIAEGGEISVLNRANLWPAGMPLCLELSALGLDPEDLDGARQRAREKEEEASRKRRTIIFAGEDLDTASPHFAAQFMDLAQASLGDDAWLKRSKRRPKLMLQADGKSGDRSRGGKGGKKGRVERLSEDIKAAMGFASELLAARYLADKHKQLFNDECWVSGNRRLGLLRGNGDDSLGYDFEVNLVEGSWKYEVKSSLDDSFEFEWTQNEMRVAASLASDGKHRYRILYVPFVFDPSRWRVMELPNPLSDKGRHLFKTIGSGSTRLKFQTE